MIVYLRFVLTNKWYIFLMTIISEIKKVITSNVRIG
jgi:hypothetical protein